jgi:hypothetical protein
MEEVGIMLLPFRRNENWGKYIEKRRERRKNKYMNRIIDYTSGRERERPSMLATI